MAKSRKDSRGYVLRTGESQRKDGRYSYSYTDLDKNRRTVYAKTLVELRAKERKIIRDKEDGLLRQNPTDGLMAEIKKSHIWEDNPRHALTIPQQKAFMDYLKAHREYQGWVPIYFYTKDDFRTENHSDDR